MVFASISNLKAKILEIFTGIEIKCRKILSANLENQYKYATPIGVKRMPEDVFGDYRGRVVYHEDILRDSADEWINPDNDIAFMKSRDTRK